VNLAHASFFLENVPCLDFATCRTRSAEKANENGEKRYRLVQSIIGATEKRRERGAVCRDIGDLSQRGEWGAVYQGWVLGVVEVSFARITTSHEDVAVCGICQGSAVDHPALYAGSDETRWVLSIPEPALSRRKVSSFPAPLRSTILFKRGPPRLQPTGN